MIFAFLKRVLSFVLSFILGFFTFPISFLPCSNDSDFNVACGAFSEECITLNGDEEEIILDEGAVFEDGYLQLNGKTTITFDDTTHGWFNYYGLVYSTNAYIRGELNYRCGVSNKSELFFLEPGQEVSFYSFIDNSLESTKANAVYSVSFEPLDKDNANIKIDGISLFNREIPDEYVYIQKGSYKIGVNLLWGGALSYMEDLDSNVEAVKVDGRIFVDSNASERYGTKSVNSNVNLINRHDPGRLVQQSYYGTMSGDYECGEFMGNTWSYNPVQGGNQFNDNSKIVDIKCDENSIYIKCQPLDWAKEKEHITPSYMEAYYTIENSLVHVSCRFVDFSGYPERISDQEIPAFYCIEPFNRFVYYGGDKPWTGDELSCEPELIFWPDAGYPKFNSTENWSAFIGEFDDSFGIGLYTPNETLYLAGVYDREKTTNTDPSVDIPTSYIALTKYTTIENYTPFEYDYYLTTGSANEIRNNFSTIK